MFRDRATCDTFQSLKGDGIVFVCFAFFFALSKVELFDDTIFFNYPKTLRVPMRWSLIAACSQDDWARPSQL